MSPPTHAELQKLLAQREWLGRLARRLLGDGPDADDLAQETLARALQSPTPRTRSWLAAVARNLSFEFRRSDAHRRAREKDSARSEAVDEVEALERAALQRSLIDEVMRLAEPERTAIVLRYLEGLSYEELAASQGISVVAARKRVSRAIERLRVKLDEGEGSRAAWAGVLAPFAGLEFLAPPAAAAVATQPTIIKGVLALSSKAKLVTVGLALAALVVVVITRFDLGPSMAGSLEPSAVDEAETVRGALQEPVSASTERELVTPESATVVEEEPVLLQAFPLRPESEVGTLELRVRWSDGTPAEGVSARVMPWGAEDAFLHQRSVRTDKNGLGVLDQLAPGTVGIYLDRCGGGECGDHRGRRDASRGRDSRWRHGTRSSAGSSGQHRAVGDHLRHGPRQQRRGLPNRDRRCRRPFCGARSE